MNVDYIAKNIGKSVYTLIILLIGFLIGCFIFRARTTDADYRKIIDKYAKKFDELDERKSELEAQNQQLNDDLAKARAELDKSIDDIGREIDDVTADNKDALNALRELREVQKQIQDRLLDTRSDNGGVVGGADS